MVLFLVHHADAVDAAVDPQRPLSPSGERHAEQLAARARERGFKPAVIWHSGKLRARQTAEYFWRACNPLAEFGAARALQPDDPPEWIRDVVVTDERDIMLVGHMPHLARLLTLFVTRRGELHPPFPAHGLVVLKRAADDWSEVERLM
jgi:phosphohistidine phosphatase